MSRLSELMAEFCPNGVEYKSLGELGEFYGGLTGKCKNDFADGNAKFISYMNVYSNSATKLDVDDTVKMEMCERQNAIQYGDVLFTGSSETQDECAISSVVTKEPAEKIYLNSFCFGFRIANRLLFIPDFLKYWLRSVAARQQLIKTASGVTRFNVSKKKMGSVQIPIPPLAVQEEIVRLLDAYTNEVETLTAELEAELAARRKQYGQYRDKLLTFGDDVEWNPLCKTFKMRNGYTPSKANKDFWKGGTIPWFRMEDIRENGHILSDSLQHITPEAVKGGKLLPANSIILSTTATIGEHALIIADSLANQRFTLFTKCESLDSKLNIKFAFYYFFKIDEWCKRNTNASSFMSVDMSKLKRLPFPIPSLSDQKRIVEILDKFDALCNDATAGLAAEITARKKQYDYYRDKLLTFKKKAS